MRASVVRRAGIAALMMALSCAAFVWFIRSPLVDAWVAARVAARLGPSVRFATAEFTLWPPPVAIGLDDVELLGEDGTVAARASHARCRLRLRSLILDAPVLASVAVEGLTADLVRAADGELRIGDRRVAPPDGGAPGIDWDRELPQLVLHDATLTVRDLSAGETWRLRFGAMEVEAAPLHPGVRIVASAISPELGRVRGLVTLDRLNAIATAPFRFQLEAVGASVSAVPAWVSAAIGEMSTNASARLTLAGEGQLATGAVTGSLELSDGAVAWRGLTIEAPVHVAMQGGWANRSLTALNATLDIAQLAYGAIAARALHATLGLDDAAPVLSAARWTAFGATWKQGGRVVLADPPRLEGVTLQVDQADARALGAAIQPLLGPGVAMPELDGPLAVTATASGVIGAELNGHLEVRLPTGTGSWSSVRASAPLSAAADVTVSAGAVSISNGTAEIAQVKAYDLTAGAVHADLSYANGNLNLSQVSARAFDGTWTAAGTVPLRGGPVLGTVKASGVNAGRLARAALSGDAAKYEASGIVDLTASLSGDGSGQLSVRLASPDLRFNELTITAPATASGVLRRAAGRISIGDGRVDLGGLQVAGFQARRLRTAFTSDGEALQVGPLTARALGGTWTLSASLSPAIMRSTVQARRVDLNRVLIDRERPAVVGQAKGDLQIEFERPRGGAVGGSVEVTLGDGRLFWRQLTVDAPARGRAEFLGGDTLTIRDATATAAAAAYGPLRGSDASAAFALAGGQLHFSDLRFTSCGGQWQYAGAAGLHQERPINGSLVITGAHPATVLAMMGIDGSDVDIDAGDLSGEFTGQLSDDWQQALTGRGRLSLRGGSIPSGELLTSILEAMAPSRRAGKQRQRANRLIELTQTFTVASALVRTEDLRLQTHDYQLTGKGTVGFDQRVDLATEVTLTARGIQAMLSLGSIPLPTGALPPLPPVPMQISGTIDDPIMHTTASGLPQAAVKWLADAILGAPARIGGAVLSPLGTLFGGVRDLVAPATPTPTAPGEGTESGQQ